MLKFKLFNINFNVNYLFLSMIVIYLAIDETGLFLPLSIGVIVHELSHVFFLVIFDCKVNSINLSIGAITVNHSSGIDKYKNMIAVLAGPISNLLLSLLFYRINFMTHFYVNIILFIYNLLPINGLDGGELIKLLFNGVLSAEKINNLLNINTVVITIMFCVMYIFVFKNINAVFIILFCIYLISPLLLKKLLKDK